MLLATADERQRGGLVSDTVVVGFIRSQEGQAAVDAAVEEVGRRGGRLVVVHSSKGGDQDPETVIADREAVEALETRLRSEGIEVVVRDFARGNDPAEDLVDVAEREQAALLVIGLRRRSPVGKLLLGSNAQRILLTADCPVLAVKAR
jgi:nucleotide-binding universal stress UspA family protein